MKIPDQMDIGQYDDFISAKINKISMEVCETQEDFIFKTIYPFIENAVEMKINKRELVEALLMYRTFKEKMEAYYGKQGSIDI